MVGVDETARPGADYATGRMANHPAPLKMSKYPVRRIKSAPNPWLFHSRPNRRAQICGVMVHSSRSGIADGDDGPRTENWMVNPKNRARIDGVWQDWGGSCDAIVFESGERVIVNPDWTTRDPTYGAGFGDQDNSWSAGWFYYQVEVGQGRIDEPVTAAALDSLAELIGELAHECGFTIQRIPHLNQEANVVPPDGVCRHDQSDNGRRLGKSDPGPLYPDDLVIAKAKLYRAALDAPERGEMDHYFIIKTTGAPAQYVYDPINDSCRHLSYPGLLLLNKAEADGKVALTRMEFDEATINGIGKVP